MFALRLALISLLVGGCATMQERRVPQAVGPELGESTAMGPRDASRPVAETPGGVPEDVGPGLAITPPSGEAPTPTQAPTAVAQEPVIILPLEPEAPPPVFQPPPPPDTYDMEDEG